MSLQNILSPNPDDLFCHEMTCDILNAGIINISGGLSLSGNVNFTGNLDVSGNIFAGGYIASSKVVYSKVGTISTTGTNTAMSSSGFINSIYNLSGNNLGSVSFTLPNADSIISANLLSDLPNSSTFTFVLNNNATGTSDLTLAASLSGTTAPNTDIYLPANTSGSVSRICTAVYTDSGPSFTIY